MVEIEKKSLQPEPKTALEKTAEQTRPGLLFRPSVDIFESMSAITLLVDLPGAKPEDLSVDLQYDILTISACPAPLEADNEKVLLSEYEVGSYYRQFSLTQEIDQQKVDARLSDGVLRLKLNKMEKAVPRKIEIESG